MQGIENLSQAAAADQSPSAESAQVLRPSDDTSIKRFGLSIGRVNFLLPQGLYSEFLSHLEISPLPNSGAYMEGLINVRGNIVPVYNINAIVDESGKAAKTALLIGRPEVGAAVLCANKPRAIQVNPGQRILPTAGLSPIIEACCDAAYAIDHEHWLSLDHEKLFGSLAQAGSFDQLINQDTPSATIQ